MKKLGCLLVLLVAGWLCLELLVYLEVSRWVGKHFFGAELSGYLPVALFIIVCLVVGVRLAQRQGKQIMGGLLTGTAGTFAVGTLGAVLFAVPGLLLKGPGLLLLLPPMQRLLGAVAMKVVGAVVRQQMAKMMGGGFPAGGFPVGGFPFPGGPDDRTPFPGMKPRPKIIDTTAEKQ
jgi:UPF0716 protein FxsA